MFINILDPIYIPISDVLRMIKRYTNLKNHYFTTPPPRIDLDRSPVSPDTVL